MNLKTNSERQRLIKLIHVGRRQLNMDEDSYRQMLANIPVLEGATSIKDLSVPKLTAVLELMKRKGFRVVPKAAGKTKPDRKLADDAQSKLIRHLWLSLHEAGKVRDPSERALAAYVCRIAKIEALQWLDTKGASQVIETLKKWLKRAGGKK
jgi:phage gp16-like protein